MSHLYFILHLVLHCIWLRFSTITLFINLACLQKLLVIETAGSCLNIGKIWLDFCSARWFYLQDTIHRPTISLIFSTAPLNRSCNAILNQTRRIGSRFYSILPLIWTLLLMQPISCLLSKSFMGLSLVFLLTKLSHGSPPIKFQLLVIFYRNASYALIL